jgi:hypothetical protein
LIMPQGICRILILPTWISSSVSVQLHHHIHAAAHNIQEVLPQYLRCSWKRDLCSYQCMLDTVQHSNTFWNMCAVPNMTVFCSSLMSCYYYYYY